jgi:hypothetical protein
LTTANRAKARTSGQHCRCAFDGKRHEVECNLRSVAMWRAGDKPAVLAVLYPSERRSRRLYCCSYCSST